ncbi:hypothetical protein J5Y05_12490 [Streptomyces sp. RG38]|uniref:Lipoprotein n=1 Tax=Streptomyces tagetis TaxID=2820809 RepID=A0A940XM84_9ACTN|nr:hypothetical protein [Streptomyces sp. RG38]
MALSAVLAGALTLTACTGDGTTGNNTPPTASDAPGTSANGSPGAASGDGTAGGSPSADSSDLDGSWLATTDGHAVALMVTGDRAALFATGGTMCSGAVDEDSGVRTIRLTCTTGQGDRTSGTVASVGRASLTVTWQGTVGEETYTRSEGGTLPSGFPTPGLGT